MSELSFLLSGILHDGRQETLSHLRGAGIPAGTKLVLVPSEAPSPAINVFVESLEQDVPVRRDIGIIPTKRRESVLSMIQDGLLLGGRVSRITDNNFGRPDCHGVEITLLVKSDLDLEEPKPPAPVVVMELRNAVVAIDGRLSTATKERLARILAEKECTVQERIVPETQLLIVAENIANKETAKRRRALSLQRMGHPIQIVSERNLLFSLSGQAVMDIVEIPPAASAPEVPVPSPFVSDDVVSWLTSGRAKELQL